MKELNKYFLLPDGIHIKEPSLYPKEMQPMISQNTHRPLSDTELTRVKVKLIDDIEWAAPDLKSNGLAQHYADSLFNKLLNSGAQTIEDIRYYGSNEFYHVGKDILGPLAVSFVDSVLVDCHGKAIFPARDATPFFYIAKTLKTLQPDRYPLDIEDIQNPVFNRKLWGIEDEQDITNDVLNVTNPAVQKLLAQMGFWSCNQKSFIEVGCWGSMIDQLKQAMQRKDMPEEVFSVHFLYTHLPEYISGYMNLEGHNFPDDVLETIADTWEAFPKFFKRPTQLVEENGVVKASLEGKIIDSPFLADWSLAALQGVVDAASTWVNSGMNVCPPDELNKLWQLSIRAQQGEFTGVLPYHTETWSEGDEWKKSWSWGKIPPLKN